METQRGGVFVERDESTCSSMPLQLIDGLTIRNPFRE